MLVDLDHAKAAVIVFVDYSLDAGGFTGSAVTEKENVISLSSLDKSLGITDKFFFLKL